jgi:hypothetical protein
MLRPRSVFFLAFACACYPWSTMGVAIDYLFNRMQFVLLTVNQNAAERWSSIVGAPLNLVFVAVGYIAVRKEIKVQRACIIVFLDVDPDAVATLVCAVAHMGHYSGLSGHAGFVCFPRTSFLHIDSTCELTWPCFQISDIAQDKDGEFALVAKTLTVFCAPSDPPSLVFAVPLKRGN